MTAFCLQEFTISGFYLYETRNILKAGDTFREERTRRVMLHLIYINALIILLDLVLLGIEYASFFEIETSFKGAVYGIKLKLEFAILNQLMDLSRGSLRSNAMSNGFGLGQSHSNTKSTEIGITSDVVAPSKC
jgi:hypothetical protein